MKKCLFIFMLLALSFAGRSEERAIVPQKTYTFVYENTDRLVRVLPGLHWYHEVELYIDGKYKSTFRFGRGTLVPIAWGFYVPVGSSWELKLIKSYAEKDGYPAYVNVFYETSGFAADGKDENLLVYVRS